MALHTLPLEVMYDIENMAKADNNDDGYYDGQDDDNSLLYQVGYDRRSLIFLLVSVYAI